MKNFNKKQQLDDIESLEELENINYDTYQTINYYSKKANENI